MLNFATRIDVVFDVRHETSVKLARAARSSGIRTKVRPSTKIPNNWQGFLRVTENLTELIEIISSHVQQYTRESIIMLATNGEHALSSNTNTEYISPCSHEEADYRMLLHISDMVRNNVTKIRIRTIDRDVLVIAIGHFHDILGLEELWVAFGKGNSSKYIPIHKIAHHLGSNKCKGLLGFHSLTGCDSNSAFYGVGKKRAWTAWRDFPEATDALVQISSTAEEVPDHTMTVLEELVVRMYSSTLTDVKSVNRARFEMFHYSGKDFDHLPQHRMLYDIIFCALHI